MILLLFVLEIDESSLRYLLHVCSFFTTNLTNATFEQISEIMEGSYILTIIHSRKNAKIKILDILYDEISRSLEYYVPYTYSKLLTLQTLQAENSELSVDKLESVTKNQVDQRLKEERHTYLSFFICDSKISAH